MLREEHESKTQPNEIELYENLKNYNEGRTREELDHKQNPIKQNPVQRKSYVK